MLCELVTGSCDSIDDCALRVIRRFGGTALSSLPIALPPPTRIPCDPQPPSETLTGSIHDRHCERLRRDLEHRSTIDRSSVLDRSLFFLAPMLYCFGWLFCAAKVREFGAARNSPLTPTARSFRQKAELSDKVPQKTFPCERDPCGLFCVP